MMFWKRKDKAGKPDQRKAVPAKSSSSPPTSRDAAIFGSEAQTPRPAPAPAPASAPEPAAAAAPVAPAPAATSAPVSAPSGQGSVSAGASLSVSDMTELVSTTGRPAKGSMAGKWFALGPSEGGRSAAALQAAEGDNYRATASVTLLKPSTNGIESGYFFGPLFLDKDGNVLKWWKKFDMPAAGQPAEISVEYAAPAGTESVRLGLNGTVNPKGDPGDYVVGFSDARLEKVTG